MTHKKLLYVVLLLLSLSLAAAVNISTDKTEYDNGEIVTANISSCTGISITKFLNPDGDLADIKSGQGNWAATYHTSSDSTAGKYTISTSCSNGLAQANFCVDAPGCLAEEEEECISDWDCEEWSDCGMDQLERRTCVDKNNCKADQEETKVCAVCQESWACLSWSGCQNGVQTRTCYDQNNCGTFLNKPAGQQICEVILPKPSVPLAKSPIAKETFFQKYGTWVVGVAVAAVLAVLVLLALRFFRPKNLAGLQDWIGEEREKGLSDDEMRRRASAAGWTDKDIKAAFKKLK